MWFAPWWVILSTITCLGLLVACLGLAMLLISRYKLAGIGISLVGLLISASTLVVFWFALPL